MLMLCNIQLNTVIIFIWRTIIIISGETILVVLPLLLLLLLSSTRNICIQFITNADKYAQLCANVTLVLPF